MSSNYPAAADDNTTLPDPTTGDYTNNPSHIQLHANANDAIKELEAKIGFGSTAQTPPGSNYILTSDSAGNSKWAVPPNSAVWGLVSGTLSNQTDLQTALNAKLNLSGGTMTGLLILSADPAVALGAATKQYVDGLGSTSYARNETPGGSVNGSNVDFTTSSTYATGSLRVHLNGQRLAPGSGVDYVEVAQGFTMQYAPATGDVLLVDYEITNTTRFVQGSNSSIVQETPSGSINSSNKIFTTLLGKYVPNSLEVYLNGLLQSRTTDYAETTPGSGIFTFVTAPVTGDDLRVGYQYATGASGNADTLDGLHAEDILPTGSVLPYAGVNAPSGWLFCFGQAVSRTTYAVLFSALSTTYGVGDGSTTFNLPDMRGRVPAGQDDMGGSSANRLTGISGSVDGDVLGGTGGAEGVTLTPANYNEFAWMSNQVGSKTMSVNNNVNSGATFGFKLHNTGQNDAHNNVQPTIILNYIIRAA